MRRAATCTDLATDNNNCGKCGTVCTSTNFFTKEACCSSSCVNLFSDKNNCGKCGNVCNPGPCFFGMCQ
jgi:hypothetical protein